MKKMDEKTSKELTEHFFRNEYGKITSVITRYLGAENVETAEDIVQDTLLKATDYWQQNGIPDNPQGWLYTTAKNLTLNILKRKKYLHRYQQETLNSNLPVEQFEFSEQVINDEQLKMMFVCCHPSISEKSQIVLILKILCGFSITEIAHAFFSKNETINKQLVRGRKQLRENKVPLEIPNNVSEKLNIILKTIYLLFNEGYYPLQKSEVIRYDLCLEAIRLVELLVAHRAIDDKSDCYALLALMYLNGARFEARMDDNGDIIPMEEQDRTKWNRSLISQGTHYLHLATQKKKISRYLILATISANHCVAKNFADTNWKEILSLYNELIIIEDSPIARLNRCVALAKVEGNKMAIDALQKLEASSDIGDHFLFHSTLAELYKDQQDIEKAISQLKKAISLAQNDRDLKLLQRKLASLVPIS